MCACIVIQADIVESTSEAGQWVEARRVVCGVGEEGGDGVAGVEVFLVGIDGSKGLLLLNVVDML